MKVQCISLDLISSLPPNLIEMILVLLPIRDAFRTSILSQKWRYHCFKIPKLVFDNRSLEGSKYNQLSVEHKLSQVIFPLLSLHHGALLEFSLCFVPLPICREIDLIILHLSRIDTVEKFTLHCNNNYKLPSSFFSMNRLKHLELCSCEFRPPSSFRGFSRLTCLYLENVSITTKTLMHLLSNCAQLKNFTLFGVDVDSTGKGESNLTELFNHLREIECLEMDFYSITKHFTNVGLPRKLSTLAHLKDFNISHINLTEQHQLSLVLLLIRSSPNLQSFGLWLDHHAVEKEVKDIIGLFETQDVSLEHLKKVSLDYFMNLDPELEFVKFILSKASKLNILELSASRLSKEKEVEMQRDLLSLPRASPTAKILFM